MRKEALFLAGRGLLVVLFVVGSVGLLGCGTSMEEVCENTCDCIGCSEPEFDECIENMEDLKEEADEHGCSEVWEEFLDCWNDTLECEEGEFHIDDECEDIFDDCST